MAKSHRNLFENTVGKGEIACYEQFLLIPQRFQKACFPGASKGVIVWEWVKDITITTIATTTTGMGQSTVKCNKKRMNLFRCQSLQLVLGDFIYETSCPSLKVLLVKVGADKPFRFMVLLHKQFLDSILKENNKIPSTFQVEKRDPNNSNFIIASPSPTFRKSRSRSDGTFCLSSVTSFSVDLSVIFLVYPFPTTNFRLFQAERVSRNNFYPLPDDKF